MAKPNVWAIATRSNVIGGVWIFGLEMVCVKRPATNAHAGMMVEIVIARASSFNETLTNRVVVNLKLFTLTI